MRPALPHLLLALLLLTAAAALPRPCSAQQDEPLRGFGLSLPNTTTRVWVSVFLDRLLNVNGDDYEFTVSGWPRALPDPAASKPPHRSPSGSHTPLWEAPLAASLNCGPFPRPPQAAVYFYLSWTDPRAKDLIAANAEQIKVGCGHN
jgi:hypothetical protein